MKSAPHGPQAPPVEKVQAVVSLLDKHYPKAGCTLDFQNPLQLLVATILSAQCTDERVNKVTPGLFAKYPDADAFADASLEELEADIKSTGFYRNKAKSIQGCCQAIREGFQGQVPADLDALVGLPGIGRKTANVVLGNAYGFPAVTVDTHVGRVAQRLGLTSHKDAVKIEKALMAILPEERWLLFSHQLILHGRTVCHSRKPLCPECPLLAHCDYGLAQEATPRP